MRMTPARPSLVLTPPPLRQFAAIPALLNNLTGKAPCVFAPSNEYLKATFMQNECTFPKMYYDFC